MKLLKRLYMMILYDLFNIIEKVNAIQTIDTSNVVKKLNTTNKLVIFKKESYWSWSVLLIKEFNELAAENFKVALKTGNLAIKLILMIS